MDQLKTNASDVENSTTTTYNTKSTTNELDIATTATNPIPKTTNVLRPVLSLESAVRFGLA